MQHIRRLRLLFAVFLILFLCAFEFCSAREAEIVFLADFRVAFGAFKCVLRRKLLTALAAIIIPFVRLVSTGLAVDALTP